MAGLPLTDYLLRECRKLAAYPTAEEMRERLRSRPPYRGSVDPTKLLRQDRDGQ
jgi:hypothetical protein